MRELIDLLSVVFSPMREGGGGGGVDEGDASGAAGSPSTQSHPPIPPADRRGSATLNPTASAFVGSAAAVLPGMPPLPPPSPSPAEAAKPAAAAGSSASQAASGGAAAAPRPAAPAGPGQRAPAPAAAADGGGGGGGGEFWRCWPLFKAYEPDPAAVIPRARVAMSSDAAGKRSAAKTKEDAESRLRVSLGRPAAREESRGPLRFEKGRRKKEKGKRKEEKALGRRVG